MPVRTCTAQVELLVQSRNVRERLDGDEPLQNIPERPSQEALLSQQEDMLQEMQTRPDRMQSQPTQLQKLPASSDHAESISQENSHDSSENKEQQRSQSASPGSPTDHRDGATDNMESDHVSHEAAAVLPAAATVVEQQSGHRQHPLQAVNPCDESRQPDLALLAAPTRQLSADASGQEQEHVTQVAADAPVGTGASGVLAIDDSDDLEFELAQQMEDAAKAASKTQHDQQVAHAQLDAGSKSQAGSVPALMQTERPAPQQAGHQPVVQPRTHLASAAEPQSQPAGPAEGKESAAAVAAQRGSGQFSTFNSSMAFQDNDMEIDDDLAQLLDAATALRPAGPPNSALAGPGPASTSSSHPNSRSNSLRSHPNSAGSHPGLSGTCPNSPATFHQAAPIYDAHLPQQADRPLDAPIQPIKGLPKGRQQPGSITAPARESEDGMLALEPAGPADLVDQNVSMPCHITLNFATGPEPGREVMLYQAGHVAAYDSLWLPRKLAYNTHHMASGLQQAAYIAAQDISWLPCSPACSTYRIYTCLKNMKHSQNACMYTLKQCTVALAVALLIIQVLA